MQRPDSTGPSYEVGPSLQGKCSRAGRKEHGEDLGKGRKKPTGRTHLALPASCGTQVRCQEMTDRSGVHNRDIRFKFLLVLTRCMEGANQEISPFQCFRPSLAGAIVPARVRWDLALLVPARATLAAVLSLHEKTAIPFCHITV